MQAVHHLPVTRSATLVKDVFHIPVSTGWVLTLGQKNSLLLIDTVPLIKQVVRVSTVAHVDETGLGVARASRGFIELQPPSTACSISNRNADLRER